MSESETVHQGLLNPLPIPEGRFKEVTMDFLTGIPPTPRGNDMIMVIMDRLSKRTKLIACNKSLTARGAAILFMEHYFVNFGIPRKIVSDKDVRFMATFWKTIWAALGASLLFTTTSHPQTDGQSERMMRVLNQCLRSTCVNNLSTWDDFLPAIEFAYNSTRQASTQQTPFEVDLGVNPDAPTYSSTWNLDQTNPYAEDLAAGMKATAKQVQDQLVDSQRQQERQANKTRNPEAFKVGDWVLLHKNVWGTRDTYGKLKPYYLGPFQIVKKLEPNAVELALPTMDKHQRTINVEWLKLFREREEGKWAKIPPRTPREAKTRIGEVTAIVGVNPTEEKFTVTWAQCNPKHASVIEAKYLDLMKNQEWKKTLLQDVDILQGSPIPEPYQTVEHPSLTRKENVRGAMGRAAQAEITTGEFRKRPERM